jgi:thymidylate kinase
MRIYITGIDGAGKTTIIEKLKTELFFNEEVEVIWARYKPKLLRYVVAPFKKSKTKGSTNFNDMNDVQYSNWSAFKKKITRNKSLSSVIFTIQYIEYSITVNNVLSKIKKGNSNTIVDRFILDFLVDQSVNHKLSMDNWIVKRLLSKLRLFDYIVFVDVDEHIAFERKDDIPSKEYLSVRRTFYKAFVKELDNAFVVSNNNNLSDAIESILKKIH